MKKRPAYERQQWLGAFQMAIKIPNFFAFAISAFMSRNLIVWIDFMDSLGVMVGTAMVAVVSRKLKYNLKYEYNYGVGKLEAFSSICCSAIDLAGFVVMTVFAVGQLFSPHQPDKFLLYVVGLKLINITLDLFCLLVQWDIVKEESNMLTKNSLGTCQKDLAFDVVALLAIIICWALRNNRAGWYFSPVMCLIMVAYFGIEGIKTIRASLTELTDKTLPEKEQMKIMKVLLSHYADYSELVSVNSHQSGEKSYIDLHLKFENETTYQEIEKLRKEITEEIEIDDCSVTIVID